MENIYNTLLNADPERVRALTVILDELRDYDTDVLVDIANDLSKGHYLTTDYT